MRIDAKSSSLLVQTGTSTSRCSSSATSEAAEVAKASPRQGFERHDADVGMQLGNCRGVGDCHDISVDNRTGHDSFS